MLFKAVQYAAYRRDGGYNLNEQWSIKTASSTIFKI
ncbi:hypothetical protein VIS19158_23190 [Vibrio scophthalmi LMG 19158]|uniref:Uncharacterized protein n=1 Tax=Vibrio scophthalmi LMG 19158 TaxID=870967 RepID=F9RKB5_9VIBR|nr:hypothetical protein VIS19158_23190 [Vibrio scophthalmi LMG 19158]